MEDGRYSRTNCLLDIVDTAWLTDTLSDVEVEIPKHVHLHEEDNEDVGGAAHSVPLDRWTDLGFPTLSDDG